jgi:hypothetical protein
MNNNNNNNNNNKNRMRGRNRKGPNPLTRSFESNGGDVKIRGTALHIAEKYVQLARDAQSSGDRVAGENYLQHAEHYYRIVAAAQAQLPQPQPVFRNDEDGAEDEDGERNNGYGERAPFQPAFQGQQPAFLAADPQPYLNGSGQADEDQGGPQAQEAGGDQSPQQQPPREEFADRGGDRGGYQNNPGGGNFRGGRRRRPYRERNYEPRDNAGETSAAPAPAASAEAPPGDD